MVKGQRVEYNHVWAGGREPLKTWSKGYVVLEPVSPYNPHCALIQRDAPGILNVPFNAPFYDLRPELN